MNTARRPGCRSRSRRKTSGPLSPGITTSDTSRSTRSRSGRPGRPADPPRRGCRGRSARGRARRGPAPPAHPRRRRIVRPGDAIGGEGRSTGSSIWGRDSHRCRGPPTAGRAAKSCPRQGSSRHHPCGPWPATPSRVSARAGASPIAAPRDRQTSRPKSSFDSSRPRGVRRTRSAGVGRAPPGAPRRAPSRTDAQRWSEGIGERQARVQPEPEDRWLRPRRPRHRPVSWPPGGATVVPVGGGEGGDVAVEPAAFQRRVSAIEGVCPGPTASYGRRCQ